MTDTPPTNYASMYNSDPDPVEETLEEEVPAVEEDPAVEPEEVPDAEETYVMVNLEDIEKVRVRSEPTIGDNVVTLLPTETILRVISDENPDWVFVEIDGGARGYIKRQFVI